MRRQFSTLLALCLTGFLAACSARPPLPQGEMAKLFESKEFAVSQASWVVNTTSGEVFDREYEFQQLDDFRSTYDVAVAKYRGIRNALIGHLRGGSSADMKQLAQDVQDLRSRTAEVGEKATQLAVTFREHATHRDPQLSHNDFVIVPIPTATALSQGSAAIIKSFFDAWAAEQERRHALKLQVADDLAAEIHDMPTYAELIEKAQRRPTSIGED